MVRYHPPEETGEVPPLPPPSAYAPKQQNGAEMLIGQAEKAISGAYDAVVTDIDEMVTKLESVKESIRAKRDSSIAGLKDFVHLSAQGLESVRQLDIKVQELIKNHLT